MRYIVSAGGTGGHIYPALAIIDKIKQMDKKAQILYIVTTDRMEKDIIPNMKIDYEGIKISGLSKNPFKLAKALYYNVEGIRKCKTIIKKFAPDLVIGVGGYVTFPVVYSAKKLGVKTLLHEQNSIPGKANRLLSKYADVICVSLEDSLKYFPKDKTYFTGNPRGEEVLKAKKITKESLGLSSNKKLVLITTGSLGASTVNEKVKETLPLLKKEAYEVLFVTGKSNYEEMKKYAGSNVKIVPYIDNMKEVLQVVDVLVSRAGATTISELLVLGIPSILIPSPYVANNHQYYNAKSLADHNACILLEEKDLTKENLLAKINLLIKDDHLRKEISANAKKLGVKDSASKIYEQIERLLNGDKNE